MSDWNTLSSEIDNLRIRLDNQSLKNPNEPIEQKELQNIVRGLIVLTRTLAQEVRYLQETQVL